jgi:3D (Asp-Asp-Asp) domain-containing protein
MTGLCESRDLEKLVSIPLRRDRLETMKHLSIAVVFLFTLAAHCASGREQSILVRVTGYWPGEGSGDRAAWNSARLRVGHCAVDPKKIPFGSKIVFPDMECVAVDTGSAVVSRKSARYCGRNSIQKNALVIDRFFATKRDAVVWSNAHPQFITVRVIAPEKQNKSSVIGIAARHDISNAMGFIGGAAPLR